MPKEKLVSVIVHTPFKLTLSTGAVVEYTKGHHNMPEEHAGHWFTQRMRSFQTARRTRTATN